MMLMFVKDIRGEVSQTVKRCAKASNNCMKEQYKTDEASKYLQYLDGNKLIILFLKKRPTGEKDIQGYI